LQLDAPIVPVTFQDSEDCTQTYDHPRSVGSPTSKSCGKDSKAAAEGLALDKGKKEDPRDTKANELKDAKD